MVIFDEAHNLESVASEASSFELTSAQIAGAQEEALRCHKIYSEGGTDQVRCNSRTALIVHSLRVRRESVCCGFCWRCRFNLFCSSLLPRTFPELSLGCGCVINSVFSL